MSIIYSCGNECQTVKSRIEYVHHLLILCLGQNESYEIFSIAGPDIGTKILSAITTITTLLCFYTDVHSSSVEPSRTLSVVIGVAARSTKLLQLL